MNFSNTFSFVQWKDAVQRLNLPTIYKTIYQSFTSSVERLSNFVEKKKSFINHRQSALHSVSVRNNPATNVPLMESLPENSHKASTDGGMHCLKPTCCTDWLHHGFAAAAVVGANFMQQLKDPQTANQQQQQQCCERCRKVVYTFHFCTRSLEAASQSASQPAASSLTAAKLFQVKCKTCGATSGYCCCGVLHRNHPRS